MRLKERVILAINHKEAYKVTINLGGMICCTLISPVNNKLKNN